MVKIPNNKWIRILAVLMIQFISFSFSYVYFRYLYVNEAILSVSKASEHLYEIVFQTTIVTMPTLVAIILSLILLKKKAITYFFFKIEKKPAKNIVLTLALIYLISLIRQLIVCDDRVTVLFKWVYYLVFVAFFEEFEYRALMPALLKGYVDKKIEWLLPNILFSFSHILIPMVQGKSVFELIVILSGNLVGYTLMGMFWEWCKRKSGTLWISVLIHAIMDFGI